MTVYSWSDLSPSQRSVALQVAEHVHYNFQNANWNHWVTMTAIAGAESSMNPWTPGDKCTSLTGASRARCNEANCEGYASHSVWQIFMGWQWDKIIAEGGPDPRIDGCVTRNWLVNIDNATRVARRIYDSQGYGAWSAYNNKAYLQWWNVAAIAVNDFLQQNGEQHPPNGNGNGGNGGGNGPDNGNGGGNGQNGQESSTAWWFLLGGLGTLGALFLWLKYGRR